MAILEKNSPKSNVLFKTNRKLVASAGFLDNCPVVSEPSQLLDWDWLELAQVGNTPLKFTNHGTGASVSIKPKANIHSTDAQALYQLSRAGLGLAIVPEFMATDDVASGRVKYVLPEWELMQLSTFAIWPDNAPKHGLIQLVVKELAEQFK